MSLTSKFVFVGIVASLAGCGSPAPTSTPVEHPTAQATQPEQDVASPINARLEAPQGVPQPGQLTITWFVEQPGSLNLPLDVSVMTPSGVTVSGDTTVTIQPGERITRGVLTVEFEVIPADDLVVVVHGAAEHAGFHAELPYRFGRPEPVVADPVRSGPALRIGGRDLGQTIPAQ